MEKCKQNKFITISLPKHATFIEFTHAVLEKTVHFSGYLDLYQRIRILYKWYFHWIQSITTYITLSDARRKKQVCEKSGAKNAEENPIKKRKGQWW